MRNLKAICTAIAVAGLCVGLNGRAVASIFIGSGTGVDNTPLAASVSFSLSGNTLTVTLVNTSTRDIHTTGNLLTAVFFSSNGKLTPQTSVGSATVTGTEWNAAIQSDPGVFDVRSHWEYASSLTGMPGGATAGISSTGLGKFGSGNFAPVGVSLDGPEYGLVPAANYRTEGGTYDGLDNNNGRPVYQNSVMFLLTASDGFTVDSISNVGFQYGTALAGTPGGEPYIPAVPEPATMLAGALLLLPFGASAIRIMRKNK